MVVGGCAGFRIVLWCFVFSWWSRVCAIRSFSLFFPGSQTSDMPAGCGAYPESLGGWRLWLGME